MEEKASSKKTKKPQSILENTHDSIVYTLQDFSTRYEPIRDVWLGKDAGTWIVTVKYNPHADGTAVWKSVHAILRNTFPKEPFTVYSYDSDTGQENSKKHELIFKNGKRILLF